MLSQCKLCGQIKPLIKSHIIPKFLFPQEGSILTSYKSLYAKRRRVGSYDSTILCEDCDSLVIGKFDTFASEVLIHRKGVILETVQELPHQPVIKIYRLKDKAGYDIIARFFISILWRASVSTHEDFFSFSLGPYELIAKQVILDSRYDYSSYFSISLGLLCDLQRPIHIISNKRKKIEGVNFYIFIIGFFKVMIKCDRQKLPTTFQSQILSAKNNILMLEIKLENCPEYQIYEKTQRKLQET